ncbi:Uncharacterized protein Rs2_36673 [Raphanus sativus]|nr:Uncharacterized protein Rs2_36673 [Raphanus sativus]
MSEGIYKNICLRTLFEEHIASYENGETSLEKLTQKVLGDRVETVPGDKMSSIFAEKKDYHGKKWYGILKKKKRYGTMSSTAFYVKRVLEVTEEAVVHALEGTFYELYHSRGRKVTFDIIEA